MTISQVLTGSIGATILLIVLGGLLARWMLRDERDDEISATEYAIRMATARAAIAGEREPREADRYRFLLAMLIDRGVLRQHERIRQPDGTLGSGWILHGIYGVDDSGDYRGYSHLGPEEAINSAIMASRGASDTIARSSDGT